MAVIVSTQLLSSTFVSRTLEYTFFGIGKKKNKKPYFMNILNG